MESKRKDICKMEKTNKRKIFLNILSIALIVLLIIVFVSGILIGPLSEFMIMKLIHKLSSVLFVAAAIIHIVQYKK